MNKQLQGHFAIISANIIFGLGVPVTKSLIENWITPSSYTLLRMIFGAFVFWIIGMFARKEKVAAKDLFIITIGSFFGFSATQLLFAIALEYTTPVYFSLLMALTPVLVLIMSLLFLKEFLTGNKVMGVILSIAGAALIILNGGSNEMAPNNTLGIILSFLAALSYGIYIIVTRNVSVKYSPITVIKWLFLFSAVMLVPFGITELPAQRIFSKDITLNGILQLSFLLIVVTAIGFSLMPVGLKYIKATTVSIYMNLQPIVASTVAIAIGQDLFSWEKPVAAILVIAGVLLVSYKSKPKTKGKKVKIGQLLNFTPRRKSFNR